jgi:hypothetical protein
VGEKVKPRHLVRNHLVKDMFLNQGRKAGPMRDRREKRLKSHRNLKAEDFEDDFPEEVDDLS